jgi:hypothetical protein
MLEDATNMVTGDCLIVQPIHPAGPERLSRAGPQLRMSTATDAATLVGDAKMVEGDGPQSVIKPGGRRAKR